MSANLIDLLDYLEEVIRLRSKVVCNIDDHKEFSIYKNRIEGIDSFIIEENEYPIIPPNLKFKRSEIPPCPEPPEDLQKWILWGENEFSKPIPKDYIKIEVQQENEESKETQKINFEDSDTRVEKFKSYLEKWEKWKEDNYHILEEKNVYKDLFKAKNNMNYKENLELVLGYGIMSWKKDGMLFKYPILTHNYIMNHLPENDLLEIKPPDDAEWKLQAEQLNEIIQQDITEIKDKFANINPEDFKPFNEILNKVKGLSPEGEIKNLENVDELKITKNLTIYDEWVLFVRKKSSNEQLKDIHSFKEQIGREGFKKTTIIKDILNENNEQKEWDKNELHNEWDSLLDDKILFPKETNKEQIRILDYLSKSNGVVVQGPPGTGKSHTIVNLISHFIAHGKKVLVSSQKEQALKVLNNMLPEPIRDFCLSVFYNDENRNKKLGKSINRINEIVNNEQIHNLKEQKEELEYQFRNKRSKLEEIKKDLYNLSKSGRPVVNGIFEDPILPTLAQQYVNENIEKYSWFKDIPEYQIVGDEKNRQEIVKLRNNIPITRNEFERMKELQVELGELITVFDNYTFPSSDDILSPKKFKKISEDLLEIDTLENDIKDYYKDIKFINDKNKINQTYKEIKNIKDILEEIKNTWALKFLKNNKKHKDDIVPFQNKLENIFKGIQILNDEYFLTHKIKYNEEINYSKLKKYIEFAIDRVNNDKKPFKTFNVFNRERKNILKKILIDNEKPVNQNQWKKVLQFIRLQEKINEFKNIWRKLRLNFEGEDIPNLEGNKISELRERYNELNLAMEYVFTKKDKVLSMLKEIILNYEILIENMEEEVDKLTQVLKYKTEQFSHDEAVSQFNKSKNILDRLVNNNGHQICKNLRECLEVKYHKVKGKKDKWIENYEKLLDYEQNKSLYDEYVKLISVFKEQAPKLKKDLKNENINLRNINFEKFRIAWNINILQNYLTDISNKEKKITKLENNMEEYQEKIKKIKEQLVLVNLKINLKNNLTKDSLTSLKKWQYEMKQGGKFTGKYAHIYRKNAQKYMKEAKNAVPAWIMPLFMVSESTDKNIGMYDVVIIDEASQSDVRSLLTLLRAKKVIIVGDDQQISPSSVGIQKNKVYQFISEYLEDFPHGKQYHLSNSLFDIAQLIFTQNVLMLKEHFRCLPEIIEFSNKKFYDNNILPLRHVNKSVKLSPVLETIFIKNGYRENKINVNEAEAICRKIKELYEDEKYQDKTFGVISLTGHAQAKYIFNKIDDYLTTKQQEEINFHAGDAYAFQGDQRDVMLLSMVVGGEEDNFQSLIGKRYKQRFNVATSRAKDKLILFHSVQLGKELTNKDDLRYQLLNFMQNGITETEVEKKRELCESPFEEEVFDELVGRGFIVNPQVEVGKYRIDLVIEGKENKLAVECDGDKYHPPQNWWKDKMRQIQLERAGWIFHRISGTSFYRDREQEIKSLLDKLNELNIPPINIGGTSKNIEMQREAKSKQKKVAKTSNGQTTNIDSSQKHLERIIKKSNGNDLEGPIEVEVIDYLVDKGYSVSTKVKHNNYEFDLVVKGENSSLAVDFDYDVHHINDEYYKDINLNKFKDKECYYFAISTKSFKDNRKELLNSLIQKLNEIDIKPKLNKKAKKQESQKKKVNEEKKKKVTKQEKKKEEFKIDDIVENTNLNKRGKVKEVDEKTLLVKVNRNESAEWYKNECEFIRKGKITKRGNINYRKIISNEVKEDIEDEKVCTECHGKMIVKLGRYGAFWGCENYPKCKHTEDLEDIRVRSIVQGLDLECPKSDCEGNLKYINTRKSSFLGCSSYPDCDFIHFF